MGRSVKARHGLAVGMSLILTGTASGKEAKPQKSGPRLGGTPGITRLCRLCVYPKPSRSLANQRHFFEGTRGSVAIRVGPGRWDEAAAQDADGPRRSDPAEEAATIRKVPCSPQGQREISFCATRCRKSSAASSAGGEGSGRRSACRAWASLSRFLAEANRP